MKTFIQIKYGAIVFLTMFSFTLLNSQQTTKTYLPTSALIANPERGWYEDYYTFANYLTGSYRSLDSVILRTHRENNQVTLILRLFYLHQFLNETAVSSDYIAKMQADFNAIRKAGVKVIVRFAYSDSQGAAIWDATPDKVMSHIESLRQVLQDNSDIITAVQAGFIGAWGEWYYTKNFARSGYAPDATDQTNRRLLVEALLNILPENIQVQVRTPAIKKNIAQSPDPIADADAYNGSIKSRIGHHDDCFVANSSDYGTYINLAQDIAYLTQETKYAIAGGETCDASNVYSDCVKAVPRMRELHWTYLNTNYNQQVYDKWGKQGCLNEANLSLGYRIHLESAVLPDLAGKESDVEMTFNFTNTGFAAPTQYKPFQVVLQNLSTSVKTILPFSGVNNDIRFWFPGSFTVSGKITLPPSVVDGNYSLSLRFPDQSASLESNPAYSIQLANIGLWDPAQGINNLNHILVIGSGGEGSIPLAPSSLFAAVFSTSQVDLSWSGNADNAAGVEIYRCMYENNEWELITTLPANSTSYSDINLNPNTNYSYLVRNINEFGKSGFSEIVTAKTQSNGVQQNGRDEMRVYPNPVRNGELYIQTSFNSETLITITDCNGNQVYSFRTTKNQVYLQNIKLLAGMYIINLQTESRSQTRKLMVL